MIVEILRGFIPSYFCTNPLDMYTFITSYPKNSRLSSPAFDLFVKEYGLELYCYHPNKTIVEYYTFQELKEKLESSFIPKQSKEVTEILRQLEIGF